MHSCRTWFWRLRRAGATATAVLLMVCMLVVQSREAAMVHVRCAEHGQLMHVRSANHIAPAPAGTSVVALPGGGDTASDHDHCALIGAKHCAQLTTMAPVASIVLAIAPSTSPELVSYAARATFRIAPKNSPPA